ncbi:MAG TPA: acVLRF1 family peptidyl-tRNA hydrolase [Candidatus Dormibacteraeota bacterium]|nr:acVLRF1 family peptidyl-tRNA hydrolase [Candidatus Dormibacteraeota bacterium]
MTGPGRWVSVTPERLDGWLRGFAGRHGEPVVEVAGDAVSLVAPDGCRARCEVPFPPLPAGATGVDDLIGHALADRTVGAVLVRLGGFAVGILAGRRLTASVVGSRPVHGRSAAGGWSQKRFARRREMQAAHALEAAVAAAVRVLVPALPSLDAVVLGGDRRAADTVAADHRLAGLRRLTIVRFLDVPDPRRRVLEASADMVRSVRINVVDPP